MELDKILAHRAEHYENRLWTAADELEDSINYHPGITPDRLGFCFGFHGF